MEKLITNLSYLSISTKKINFFYIIEGRYLIDNLFRQFFIENEYNTCFSLLFLNIKCYNLFIDYYKIEVLKSSFKYSNNDLYYIYEKYLKYFYFSGSYVYSIIHNTKYND